LCRFSLFFGIAKGVSLKIGSIGYTRLRPDPCEMVVSVRGIEYALARGENAPVKRPDFGPSKLSARSVRPLAGSRPGRFVKGFQQPIELYTA